MASRIVTGTILKPDNTPWKRARVQFDMKDDAFTLEDTYPQGSVRVWTDTFGNFSVPLAAGLSVYWVCKLPDHSTFEFALPDGPPITIEALQGSAGVPPVPPSILNELETVVDTGIAEHVAEVHVPLNAVVAGKANTSDLANYSPVTHQHPGTAANTVAVGNGAEASFTGATAVGNSALATAVNAVALGESVTAASGESTAIGRWAAVVAGTLAGTAIGSTSYVGGTAQRSTAIGYGAAVTASDTAVIKANDLTIVRSLNTGVTRLGLRDSANANRFITVSTADEVIVGTKNQVARANHTGTQLAATVSDFATAVGTTAAGVAAKTTPVDADTIPVTDSEAANALKKFTWANIKTALGTVFAPLVHHHPGAGANSVAIGTGATASASATTAIGPYSEATGAGATAIGNSKTAYGARAMSIGGFADAPDSVAIGDSADIAVAATEAISIGSGSFVDGVSGIAIGGQASVPSTSPRSISIGQGAFIPGSTPDRGIIRVNDLEVKRSNGTGSTSLRLASPDLTIGIVTVTDADNIAVNGIAAEKVGHAHPGAGANSVALGGTAVGSESVSVGVGAAVANTTGVAIGRSAIPGSGGVSVGYGTSTGGSGTAVGKQAGAAGSQSVALGFMASAGGQNAFAMGALTYVPMQEGIGVGFGASAESLYAMAFGGSAYVAASSDKSIAMGKDASVASIGSVAFGANSIIPATSPRSVALGQSATIPASTPDRGVIRANDFEVQRSNGTGATTLRLTSPDNTVGIIAVTDTDGLTVNGAAVGGGGATDPEIVRDTIASALVAGTNVTITPNDVGDTITIAASGGGGTPTATQDAAVLPIQYADNWTISASELGRGYLAQADTLAVTDTSIMIVDFFVPYTITIDSLNISVGTLEVGGLVRIGLWQMSDDGTTHTTLVDAGTVDTDTTGGKIALITPIVLNRGWYQNGVIRSIGNTLIRIRSFSPTVKSYGGFNGGGGTYNISASGGYRTLPHAGGAAVPFDASYGAGNKSILALAAPAVYMRVQR